MNDGFLFDTGKGLKRGPLARPTDPTTSHVGEIAVTPKLKGLSERFISRLRLLKEATAQEIANGNESIRKRACVLVRSGHIVVAGERICKRTGNRAQVYRVA